MVFMNSLPKMISAFELVFDGLSSLPSLPEILARLTVPVPDVPR